MVRVNLPVCAVILVATLVSTIASMGGGLILYYQGLASLEDSMRETSAGEVDSLRQKLLSQLDLVESSANAVHKFLFSHERVLPGTNGTDWMGQVRSLAFAQVQSNTMLYFVSVQLLSYRKDAGGSFATSVWKDVLRNGSTQLVYAGRELPVPFVTTPASAYSLDSNTGYIGKHLYTYTSANTYADVVLAIDPRDGPNQSLPGNLNIRPALAGAVLSAWMPRPRKWYASDLNTYAYTLANMMYVPPPPPHPWSGYKSVMIRLGFLFSSQQVPFEVYKGQRPDTTAILVNRGLGGMVYASTEGGLVPQWCQVPPGSRISNVRADCSLRISNLSLAVQEAYLDVADLPMGSFTKMTLDGKEYFVRREDATFFNLELLWLRPTSSVEGKVREALVLLIVFTLLVLVFDTAIASLELLFIALPVRDLSAALAALGDMQLDEAGSAVAKYQSRSVMVAEMRRLMTGMGNTLQRMSEYRAFIPEAVCGWDSPLDQQAPTSESPSSRTSGGRSSSGSEPGSPVHDTGGKNLDLRLQSKPVALLAVNVSGWWKDSFDTVSALNRHTELTNTILNVMDTNCGTAKPKCDYTRRAMDAAHDVLSHLKAHTPMCAVTSGRAFVGNIGTQAVRRFSVLSPLVPWLGVLQSFGVWRNYECVTDLASTSRLSPSFIFRIVDGIRDVEAVKPVVHVVERMKLSVSEWMYEMEEAERGNKDGVALNNLARCIVMNQWDDIDSLGEALVRQLPQPLQDAFESKTFSPLARSFERDCGAEGKGRRLQIP